MKPEIIKILRGISLTALGGIIGLVGGLVIGALAGGAIHSAFSPGSWGYGVFLGGALGVLIGFVAGAGTGLLGIRTRWGLDWLVIISLAVLLGYWMDDLPWGWQASFLWAAIGAVTGWVVMALIRKILGRHLTKGPITAWIIVGYLVAFALLAFFSPKFLMGMRVALG